MSTGEGRGPSQRFLSRRQFIGGSLGLLSVGGLLAACGGGGGESAGTSAPAGTTQAATTAAGATTQAATTQAATTAAGAPVRGGTLLYSASSPPSGFDPHKWWNSLSFNGGASAVFDQLVAVDDQGQVVPSLLAELPEISPDGTLYTFTLRDGVTFHHGRALTADDVKYSLERLMSPATASEGGGLYSVLGVVGTQDLLDEKTDQLAGLKVVDPVTLTMELEQPDSATLFVLSFPFASIVPRDVIEEAGDKFNWAPVGTGPFTMREADPDRGYVLERYGEYWNPDLPYVDTVEASIGIDPELATLRIQDGELDLMEEEIPAGSLDGLRSNPELENQIYIDTVNNIYYITLSVDHEAMGNLAVRQAIAHAVDKERLVRTLKGLGEPAGGGLFSPLSPYFQDGIAYPYDPARATQLLSEAGYPDGFNVTFFGTNYTPWVEMGQTVQQDLAEIGITVDLRADVREQWLAEIVKNPPGITENQWELPYPHGSYLMDSAFTQAAIDAGCCNFSNYVSDEFEGLVKQAHRSTDPDEVVELYKRMDTIAVKDEALWVPMFYPAYSTLVSARVRGYTIPTSPGPGGKLFAQYWLEA
jgi:peptide/nickel transport system substrate-binding protein/oligopeptide transport system substrate-binding protein